MAQRERFFECVFVCERNEYQFHFRALSETDAERHFQETLRGYGITSLGTLLIRNGKGQIVRRADYTPAACGLVAAR